jgi:predicted RNA-binding protein (TIGR00451 family)
MYDPKIPIICHLPREAYHEIVNNAMSTLPHEVFFSEVDKGVTSNDSLKSLENLLIKCKDIFNTSDSKKSQYHKSWIRKFVKILDYQFGKGIGRVLFSNEVKVYPNKDKTHINIRDVNSKKVIGVFIKKSGQLELSIYGSSLIKDLIKNIHFIVFDGEMISGNTLFRPGVINFSDDLKPDNFAFIWNQKKEEIIGIARMLVGSPYIKNSNSGPIAKIYEKMKK